MNSFIGLIGLLCMPQVLAVVEPACSGGTTLTDPMDSISSPVDNRGRYPTNLNCEWRIEGPANSVISVDFLSIFIKYSRRCRRDYLWIQDGDGGSSRKYCGRYAFGFTSNSNVLNLKFRSDWRTSRFDIGFTLNYTIVGTSFGDECQSPKHLNATTDIQMDQTPGFSAAGYGNDLDCSWLITADDNHQIHIDFTSFFVEHETHCGYDHIAVYDGEDITATLIGRYCGDETITDHQDNLPPDIIKSSGSSVFVAFHSDRSVIDKGAAWNYVAIEPDNTDPGTDDACDGTPVALTNPTGTIESPLSPDDSMYYNNALCQWNIITTADMILSFTFDELDIENGGGDCIYDFVEIRDTTTGHMLELVCGTDLPGEITSRSNSVSVTFKTDSSIRKTGFVLDYETIEMPDEPTCGVPDVTIKPGAIVGGTDAAAHSFPWQISLLRCRYYGCYHTCGGSIISPMWIVTAAHCVNGGRPSQYRVRTGEHNRQINEGTESNLIISRIIVHPNYNSRTLDNDIALLEVEGEIIYSETAKPVCLPEADDVVAANSEGIITGWGSTQGTGNDDILQQAYVDVFGTSTCQSWLGRGFNPTTMICAGRSQGGVDSCFGDSGGPLIVEEGGAYVMYGVVSWGYGCAQPQKPGVYTRVANYITFINGYIIP